MRVAAWMSVCLITAIAGLLGFLIFYPPATHWVLQQTTVECEDLDYRLSFCGKARGWVTYPEPGAHKFARKGWKMSVEFDPNEEGYSAERLMGAAHRIVGNHPKNTFIDVPEGHALMSGENALIYRETAVRDGEEVVIVTFYTFLPEVTMMGVFNRAGDAFTTEDEGVLYDALAGLRLAERSVPD
ncbi:MAG: hypothetical protein AAF557_18605 [Pseudomonadota bacterium]